MKGVKFLLVVCLSLILSACAWDKEVIHDTQYIVVEPSADMIKDCEDLSIPPDRNAYRAATSQERERMLHEYASSEQTAVTKCNKRWPILRDWITQQKQLYYKPKKD